MAWQFSVALRTNRIGQLQSTVGSAGVMKIFSGSEPANCAASDPSGLLCTISLPATFLTSSSGVATLTGIWSASASSTGTAACFRIYDSSGNCHMQGNITVTGSGGDMQFDSTSFNSGQTIVITTYTGTDANS